jgi:hypothetical protein
MPPRIQLLGSTRLTRVVLPYLQEQARAKVVAVDPGTEDESRPWFAPIRQLLRDNGVPLGRADADLVLDLDPDARPDHGEGVLVRVLAPPAATSPDVNRALLVGGDWSMVVADATGRSAWATVPIVVRADDDAPSLLAEATLRGVEGLAGSLERIVNGEAPTALAAPLRAGRWRPQEAFLLWEQPAERIVARVRAASGPWGGARTHLGDTPVYVEQADLVSTDPTPEFAPGTIAGLDSGILVSTGRGIVRLGWLRPSWRPLRRAVEYAAEVGASVGYQFA